MLKDFGDFRLQKMIENRPKMPLRAVVTAGMPYGNKDLHYGHVLGMAFYADFMARFLRDRIGKDNVIFVSGADCYGSPSMEGFRKMQEAGYTGTIEDMVTEKYNSHMRDWKAYDISFNRYYGSALAPAKENHIKTSEEIFNKLYKNGRLKKMSTLQFYDVKHSTFLNGRQVIGKCPYDGCPSEKGYADECDLGHQYLPQDLIDPVSTLSGERPELKEITNWYFDLDEDLDNVTEWLNYVEKNTAIRPYVVKELREFLKKPEIYIKKDLMDEFEVIKDILPPHDVREEKSKASFAIVFDNLKDRETACQILNGENIRYRTGKTLTPFRMSGNIEWGVKVPETEGLDGLTFYCWPESLWAPISFTKTYLQELGKDEDEWKKYWCSSESKIYQVLGEDNMQFYGIPQHSMWLGTQSGKPTLPVPEGELQMSNLIVNKFNMFLGAKASSSGKIKAPTPGELLDHYTAEQLRMHFLGLAVGNTSVSFMPKAFNPDASENEADPVLKDGNLLTNVYNRVLRTLFYTWQKDFDGVIPNRPISEEVLKDCTLTILKVEKIMMENKFHMVSYELDSFIRNINKYWVKNIKAAEETGDKELEAQIIADCLHMAKVAMVLIHPVAPSGAENLAESFKVQGDIFSWDTINDPIYDFFADPNNHKPMFLEPRQDFFKKHPSQFGVEDS